MEQIISTLKTAEHAYHIEALVRPDGQQAFTCCGYTAPMRTFR